MSWSNILGHERQIDAFRDIVARGRLAHAYLFIGPPGVGKRRFARELAKALLCETGTPGDRPLAACDQCDGCKLVDAATHPDLFFAEMPEEKNEFPIEVMRDLCRNFGFKSARGHGKVGIIDDADDFNEESANCFLKTLEEPPPGSLLILIGTSLDLQMETIKSRCQIVRFAPLADEHVRTLLQQQEVTDPAMLDRLTRLASGSPGVALELADESLWRFRRDLLQTMTQPRFDSVALGKTLVAFVEDAGKESATQRRRANQTLTLLIASLTDALRLQSGGAARSAESAELPLLSSLAQRVQPDKILAMLERCLETEWHLGRYVQISLVLEGLVDAFVPLLDPTKAVPLRYEGFSV